MVRLLVVDDDALVRSSLAIRCTSAPAVRARGAEAMAGLTPREREVAVMVGEGASNGEIARALLMSETTVKTHLGHLYIKLGVDNRVNVALVVRDARGVGT